ncbi:Hypothetical predicted protein [Marmota monax]|uniref:Uncharacterized protein n=1 Tax=Marmota monax TaxID=9995 RepID=A0A5E4A7G3_MARMO|nr:hypothetical protein GHT09_008906 [Marmota monax]VTJ53203.1 Hypothetical predicted protein [Marmota monax]
MRATKEQPPQESLDGGGVPSLRGRRPQLRSLSQPLRPVPGSRSGQNGLPSPLRAARPGRSHRRASELCRRGSSADGRTAPPGQKLRDGTRRGQQRKTASGRTQLHSPRKASRPSQSHLFPVPSHAGVRAA